METSRTRHDAWSDLRSVILLVQRVNQISRRVIDVDRVLTERNVDISLLINGNALALTVIGILYREQNVIHRAVFHQRPCIETVDIDVPLQIESNSIRPFVKRIEVRLN